MNGYKIIVQKVSDSKESSKSLAYMDDLESTDYEKIGRVVRTAMDKIVV